LTWDPGENDRRKKRRASTVANQRFVARQVDLPAPDEAYDHDAWGRALKRSVPRMPLSAREIDIAARFHDHVSFDTGETYVSCRRIAHLIGHDDDNHVAAARRKLIELGMMQGPYTKLGHGNRRWYRLLMPTAWRTGPAPSSTEVPDQDLDEAGRDRQAADSTSPHTSADRRSQIGTTKGPKSGPKEVPIWDPDLRSDPYLFNDERTDQIRSERSEPSSSVSAAPIDPLVNDVAAAHDAARLLIDEMSDPQWQISRAEAEELVRNFPPARGELDRGWPLQVAFANLRALRAKGKSFTRPAGWIARVLIRTKGAAPVPISVPSAQQRQQQAIEQARHAQAQRDAESQRLARERREIDELLAGLSDADWDRLLARLADAGDVSLQSARRRGVDPREHHGVRLAVAHELRREAT